MQCCSYNALRSVPNHSTDSAHRHSDLERTLQAAAESAASNRCPIPVPGVTHNSKALLLMAQGRDSKGCSGSVAVLPTDYRPPAAIGGKAVVRRPKRKRPQHGPGHSRLHSGASRLVVMGGMDSPLRGSPFGRLRRLSASTAGLG